MALKIKTFLLALLLLFLPFTSGFVEGFRENMHPSAGHLLYRDGMKMKSRKLFGHAYLLDYGEGGASGKHRKPGKSP
ncbi:uncharacterized protein LOC114761474 [Neltuma alba]|uniref:uncharacterized protein LOC114745848 n=1 Tax=Neltuma alba TaxID=207710 RepID=UPI0010A3F527|nr:uncharacterized protein LOC114745848 [Prosopis alba]XP_028806677.1 uncharacterized protein LOC114761474 [Prosopis alba]